MEGENISMIQPRGLGISGYRSFEQGTSQLLSPLAKINLLIGQNNSGKSNILRFVQLTYDNLRFPGQGSQPFIHAPRHSALDLPLSSQDKPQELLIGIANNVNLDSILNSEGPKLSRHELAAVASALSAPAFRHARSDSETCWLRFVKVTEGSGHANRDPQRATFLLDGAQLSSASSELGGVYSYIRAASRSLFNTEGGRQGEDLGRILGAIMAATRFPPVISIDAFRQIRPDTSNADVVSTVTHSGAGLIDELAKLQNPTADDRESRLKFDSINRFIQVLLDDPRASIEIPYNRATIIVETDSVRLPLENLGTGIHQVVILAAASTLVENCLICIEEPEVHLHPLLQRKFLRYLYEETRNSYLIATHSAHLLDAEISNIFHVTRDDKGSSIRLAASPHDRAAICHDLGYRPSDLVQANSIFWVEGPSDRLYLRHWIGLVEPSLVEGIHYSIMFYGGRLLSHLSPDDPDVEDFISLRRLNRHLVILIDSDKSSPQARLNQTKKRVLEGFNSGPGFGWVTAGNTVENYVPPTLLKLGVAAMHPNIETSWNGERYENPLHIRSVGRSGQVAIDKVAVARGVTQAWDSTVSMPLDLKSKIERCIAFVRAANHHLEASILG